METYHFLFFGSSLLSFVAYFMYVYLKFGIQPSISDSYYKLIPKKQWMFTIALWGFAFSLMPVATEIHGLFFGATAFILFVGAAPRFAQKSIEQTVHIVGAIGGVAMAVIAFALAGYVWVSIFMALGIASLNWFKVPNKTWWIETYAFLYAWGALLIIHSTL